MRFRLGAAAAAVWLVIHAVLMLQGEDVSRPVEVARIALYLTAEIGALWALLVMAVRVADARPIVVWFGLAFACWFIGDVIYDVVYQFVLDRPVPYPGLPDLFYTLYFPPVLIGLTKLIRRNARTHGALPVVDSLAVVIAGFALLWFLVGGEIIGDEHASIASRAVGLSLVVGDLAVLTLGTWVVRFSYLGQLPAMRLLAAGFAGFLVGDTMYSWSSLHGDFFSGGLIDTLYIASYGAVLLSGLHPSWAELRHRDDRVSASLRKRFSVPTIGLLLIPLVLTFVSVLVSHHDHFTVVVLVITVAGAAGAGVAHVTLTGAANEATLEAEARTISAKTRTEVELNIHDSAMQEIAAARLVVEQATASGSTEHLDLATTALDEAATRIRRQFVDG